MQARATPQTQTTLFDGLPSPNPAADVTCPKCALKSKTRAMQKSANGPLTKHGHLPKKSNQDPLRREHTREQAKLLVLTPLVMNSKGRDTAWHHTLGLQYRQWPQQDPLDGDTKQHAAMTGAAV